MATCPAAWTLHHHCGNRRRRSAAPDGGGRSRCGDVGGGGSRVARCCRRGLGSHSLHRPRSGTSSACGRWAGGTGCARCCGTWLYTVCRWRAYCSAVHSTAAPLGTTCPPRRSSARSCSWGRPGGRGPGPWNPARGAGTPSRAACAPRIRRARYSRSLWRPAPPRPP